MGTALGLADEDDGQLLNEIENKKGGNEGKCFMEVVNIWLRGAGVAPKTWGTLLHCLKEIDMHDAVGSIQENILHCKVNSKMPACTLPHSPCWVSPLSTDTTVHCHGNHAMFHNRVECASIVSARLLLANCMQGNALRDQ